MHINARERGLKRKKFSFDHGQTEDKCRSLAVPLQLKTFLATCAGGGAVPFTSNQMIKNLVVSMA